MKPNCILEIYSLRTYTPPLREKKMELGKKIIAVLLRWYSMLRYFFNIKFHMYFDDFDGVQLAFWDN